MNTASKLTMAALAALFLLNLIVRPSVSFAQAGANGTALAPASGKGSTEACWVALGNKLYYVEKDDTSILKIKASGSL